MNYIEDHRFVHPLIIRRNAMTTDRPNDPNAIKTTVRDYYGQRIQKAGASCCGSSAEPTEVQLYGIEELTQLPEEVNTTSFGCGNPVALASLQPGEVVLDLGSGGGLDVLLAAKRVGAEGYVYGVDMTDEMLTVARRNAERTGASNVEFLKGDIEALPLPDNSVDVIISNCVINLSPDKGDVLREAFRVLRPGGRLAVSDIVVDGELTDLPVSETQIRTALSWAGCIAGALTNAQYRTFLAAAGFERISVDVRHRYTMEDLVSSAPDGLNHLAPEVVQQLLGRFTSSAITAWKPI
jgi:ubiquinone/menaquinone biosynthesis C-methylase UbiE